VVVTVTVTVTVIPPRVVQPPALTTTIQLKMMMDDADVVADDLTCHQSTPTMRITARITTRGRRKRNKR
jgi:hypothetical protein